MTVLLVCKTMKIQESCSLSIPSKKTLLERLPLTERLSLRDLLTARLLNLRLTWMHQLPNRRITLPLQELPKDKILLLLTMFLRYHPKKLQLLLLPPNLSKDNPPELQSLLSKSHLYLPLPRLHQPEYNPPKLLLPLPLPELVALNKSSLLLKHSLSQYLRSLRVTPHQS